MSDNPSPRQPAVPERRPLTPAAQRALAEAEASRQAEATRAKTLPDKAPELRGPQGPEPTRYGDWERNGIASDF